MPDTHTIPDAFRRQALACRHLGSFFTARVCEALADELTTETAFGARILDWPGNPVNDALALRATARRSPPPIRRMRWTTKYCAAPSRRRLPAMTVS